MCQTTRFKNQEQNDHEAKQHWSQPGGEAAWQRYQIAFEKWAELDRQELLEKANKDDPEYRPDDGAKTSDD